MDRQSRYRILLEVQKKAEALSPGSFKAWLRSEIAKVEPGRTQKAA
jgi:hypothetical protein